MPALAVCFSVSRIAVFALLPRIFSRWISLLVAGLLPLAAQASLNDLPMVPTRFALCSKEVAGLEDASRQTEMRQCLSRRYQAERILRKDCKQAVGTLRPAPKNGDERFKAERQCYIDHLSASYKDLPERHIVPTVARVQPKVKREETFVSDDDDLELHAGAPRMAPVPAPVFVAPASLEEVN